ncbi:NADP-dependent glyceraldehyde-3-phosphate dehydrogenase [Oceanirhabdus sp. W0125-5]|uniref:NADP-dependent glyceraldehyde-3-phosphate dehydrogenase n=1 Tax=Oceanirhabdus sp. W0125-5 TaxID=2999116 RepID=UPI0022F34171|nr:NADP-dependent glyceraldehyde-3-phosphate dehydrogenase [Oceanirhabdus sp. W0125-5]WBW98703.1 NADP-dependent glyceraldehyde-3-phosphate dehydrogenase [Oceanirhabdus sp. W0125-5]
MFENIKKQSCYGNFLNGQWIYSDKCLKIYNPTSKELMGYISQMQPEDVDKAVESCKNAQKTWGNMPTNERAKILHKAANLLLNNQDYIADILMQEIAKDKKSCLSEISRTADFIKFTADEGERTIGEALNADNFPGVKTDKLAFVIREPLGVVLAISPFNYPINLSVSKIAPALIAGNSVVLKPPTQGAISAMHMVEIFNQAGLPAGVLNTITGKSSEIGDYLVTHPGIDFINFTGSTKVGKHIASVSKMVPLIMELGGKDAAIVLDDANLEDAANDIVSGAFSYSGQRCTAIKRVIAINSIADKLIDLILPKVKELKVGNPKDSTITPLINDKAKDYVLELMNDAVEKGAQCLIGGNHQDNLVYPTIYDMVTEEMRIAWEEPFGPVLPIIRVSTIDEAIALANKSEYGLQSSVFTMNINNAFYVAKRLEVGTVHINNKTERGPDHFPFSGIKNSGMGTQGIRYSIEAMTRRKNIVLEYN